MKLNFTEINDITQGAVRIAENDGVFKFYRFSEEQENLYLKNPDLLRKTFSTAGIQMEFKTDGDSIYLKVNTFEGTTRTYFSYDIFVNDKLIGCLKNFSDNERIFGNPTKHFPLGKFEKEFDLGVGEKVVRIVFPWSVVSEIEELRISGATFVEPVIKNKTIIMYGDSITHGYDALHPSQSYSVRLAHAINAQLYNKAIGGEFFCPKLAKLKDSFVPDYITVAYGTNDWNKSHKDHFINRCGEFFSELSKNYPSTKIFAISPIWRKNFEEKRDFVNFGEVEKIISDICTEFENIDFISGWDFVPHNEKYFADLELHPNDEGFGLYFDALYNVLKKKLK